MSDQGLTHHRQKVGDIELHYARQGTGPVLVLLHGWPEFWRIWRRVIPPLAREFGVIAPDLRGFGESDKPPVPARDGYTLEHHVGDLLALADALGLARFGVVSHDVGAHVAQAFARAHPERLTGLFFFDCPYPGIGKRWADADLIPEIWYQSFNQQPWAASVVGATRDSCEAYLRHFLSHWAHDPNAFDDEIAAWVDNFLRPGNLQGGFNWYVVNHERRIAAIRDGAPSLPPIEVPTRVLWGERDPILRVAWADRLREYFSDCQFSCAPRAGHFVPWERPDLAVEAIVAFFRDR
jgi:pimeloyl-ACP methyl ester carboxylesterase